MRLTLRSILNTYTCNNHVFITHKLTLTHKHFQSKYIPTILHPIAPWLQNATININDNINTVWRWVNGLASQSSYWKITYLWFLCNIKLQQRTHKLLIIKTNKCTNMYCIYSKTLKKLLHVSIYQSSSGSTCSSLLKYVH
jgi:hypothetical protein